MRNIYLFAFLLLSASLSVNAQVLVLQGVTVNGATHNEVDDPNFVHDQNTPLASCTFGALTGGIAGHQSGAVCYSRAIQEGDQPQVHLVTSTSGSRVFIDGDGSQYLRVTFKNTVSNYASTETPFFARGTSELSFSADLALDLAPPGVPVTIHWRYFVFSSGYSDSETDGIPLVFEEDSMLATNVFDFNGQDLLQPGLFSWQDPGGIVGFNDAGPVYGNFDLIPGNTRSITIDSEMMARLADLAVPNSGNGGFDKDGNWAVFRGYIEFSLTPFTSFETEPTEKLAFSLDIGSDSSWGDLQQDGDENFDPGDFYLRDVVNPFPPTVLVNDSTIFNTAIIGIQPSADPLPDNPLAVLPYHALPFLDALGPIVFDLDGADYLDFSLSAWSPVYPWAAPGGSVSLFPGENFLVSFDDDDAYNWSDAPASLPIESQSPGMVTYGPGIDEVMGVDINPAFTGSVPVHYPLLTETTLHTLLTPDPLPAGGELEDDDTDALDAIILDDQGLPAATHFYFSADREAPCLDQLNGAVLDAGTIYELISPGVIQAVATPAMIGIPPGTDIDALEFGLYGDEDNPSGLLTLFFSVDEDDPQTPEDESGGLDPAMIYASFLAGTVYPYSGAPLLDDIDALALSGEWMTQGMFACVALDYFEDLDGDGFGDDASLISSCNPIAGYITTGGDCDDGNPAIYPGATGTGQGLDNNCNGVLDPDEDCLITGFEDNDSDGFGDLLFTHIGCVPPPNMVFVDGDCDDSNPAVYPGAPGTQQGLDNNCDGVVSGSERLPCPGDLNGDFQVNTGDLIVLIAQFGCTQNCGPADLNQDGTVNSADLVIFLGLFGIPCP